MKRETIFLKIALFLIGAPVLALCIFAVPKIAKGVAEFVEAPYVNYLILIGVYASALAYFAALVQAFKLLSYIDKNIAFSELSVNALKNIKYCAIAISSIYVLFLPLFYIVAEIDDAPGLIVMGMGLIFASFVIAVFAAVLQKLLKDAIDIKSENDLTV
ncbi:cellulose synthase/poly-beta-1,6-N-acetylglucosamine synthase-like glycosyltransferase [Bacillus tianshenii]|uniref:Cellulose synthase/poly-beta-1,6-N-acetylglucosamine synthase-like glycosyltransferase n=1 Tax=Sutcliffiella tianshenii TaxID=1463404 RepID=A0ABS2NYJ1_9BACI|nr:DUF2975 domain-containing protein [Bacillus tianshenii]MBM7619710.1 cellulose synthase/poly-beta-1,6-N-acetylglucosamine synthase-like glycosyltransferase [Bacillus tianshenii]